VRSFAITGVVLLAVTVVLSGTAYGGSAGSVYDMNRMLSEPHPLANQYGTRWRPATRRPAPVGQAPAPRSQPQPQPRAAGRATPVKAPAGTRAPAPAQPRTGSRGGGIFHEIKLGVLAHDQGPFSSQKEDGIDGQIEVRFVSPDILEYIGSPYPHIGADLSGSGDTNSVWLGVVWEWEFWKKMFVGWSMGGALHDGVTNQGEGTEDEKELGCNPLFRLGINVGYRFDEHHSLDLLLDHISNAKICDTNEGLENVGVRYGYRF
jgi:lipid A 3-O-deacylase